MRPILSIEHPPLYCHIGGSGTVIGPWYSVFPLYLWLVGQRWMHQHISKLLYSTTKELQVTVLLEHEIYVMIKPINLEYSTPRYMFDCHIGKGWLTVHYATFSIDITFVKRDENVVSSNIICELINSSRPSDTTIRHLLSHNWFR